MKKQIIIIFIISALSSCGKFLEPKSQSEYVPKTANAINEMLIYDAYAHTASPINECLFSYENILDDDIAITDKKISVYPYSTDKGDGVKSLFSWQPDMYTPMQAGLLNSKAYQTYYGKIKGCNVALDYIDKMSGTNDEKNYVRAQAHMLRALYYFHLVNLYGKPYNFDKNALGVPLKLGSGYGDTQIKRNSVAEVYNQVIKDLTIAEESFNSLPVSQHFMKNYRVTLPAVQLLRARVALYMEDYDIALKYSDKVMKGWGLNLYDLTSFMPTKTAPFPNYVTYDNTETMWAYGRASDVNYYAGTQARESTASAPKTFFYFNASPELLNSYDEVVGDLRKDNYISIEKTSPETKLPWGKCFIDEYYTYSSADYFGLSMRLSEAYLIYAEAVAQKNPQEAVKVLDELRAKRISNYASKPIANEDVMNFIKAERRRELCFECHRWFDLRRYGMPSFSRTYREYGEDLKIYTINKNDPAYTLPIPEDVIILNPGLVQNELTQPK